MGTPMGISWARAGSPNAPNPIAMTSARANLPITLIKNSSYCCSWHSCRRLMSPRPQIVRDNLGIPGEDGTRAMLHDGAALYHIGVSGRRKRAARVLLHDQDGETIAIEVHK